MILHTDKSMKPGWTQPFTDGSGWRGVDAVIAKSEGWLLDVGDFGIAVRRVNRPYQVQPQGTGSNSVIFGSSSSLSPVVPQYITLPYLDKEDFAFLLEQALSGNKTAYKALYLMVGNDSRYKEYADTVRVLGESYA